VTDGPITTTNNTSPPPEPERMTRLEVARDVQLDPNSLVGSWFHKLDGYGDILWQGAVVGEIQPGIYQLELFDWIEGRGYQVVVALTDMLHGNPEQEWRFYDTEERMRLGYDRPPAAIEHDRMKT
jgi:hypothetical protein